MLVVVLIRYYGKNLDHYLQCLKGHSQLCDCADLDTSFSHFEKSLPQPEIKVHLEIRFIFRSVLLDFQSFTESYLVENSIYCVSGICKLAMEWYVRRNARFLPWMVCG